MIRVRGLSKQFGARVVVDNLSFEVNKGEILGFLGPNGAGKTTTMRMIVGFLTPTSGEIFIDNFSVERESLRTRSLIGYLPENPPLYNELTVVEYLSFALRLSGVTKKKFKDRLDTVYQTCGIGDVSGRLIGNLSKGYRQRVGLAQAIIHNPKILILDEPTVGLDPKQIHEIRGVIRGLAGEHTIILSSHILPEVSKTCDRVIIINEGKIVASDTCDALSNRYSGGNRFEITVARPGSDALERLKAISGVLNVVNIGSGRGFLVEGRRGLEIREEVANLVVRENWGLLGLKAMEFSLEDVYLQLTMEE
ncbi:MAG: hypothetical protein A3F16_04145 [Deltaproteobacteria bacterium RIFCSPHIGHO2_12_FULL_43_9]|nr:MAG: hypothetical protein A3F16_04145 [Deltaproteobacteria bacterium RIFCSPHIGHO2_12_FULL_43_9]